MKKQTLRETAQEIDARLERVEQFLPTLATKAELREAIDLAVAPLATKAELASGLAATRAELRAEIREEGERTRRHFDVAAEAVRYETQMLADALHAQGERLDRAMAENEAEHRKMDGRLLRLEAGRPRQR